MNDWQTVKLKEIAYVHKAAWKVGDKKSAYVGLEHIIENNLRLSSFGCSSLVASNKFTFDAGDTLFGKLRPYFRKVVKPDFHGVCSTDIWVIKPKNGIDKNFLFYFFANQELVDIATLSSGGTRMPRADWNFLSETTWDIPLLEEQKSIALILSSLDDKIDLLHRQNKTLEALAETFFRQWFVEEPSDQCFEGCVLDEFDLTMGLSPPGDSYNEVFDGMPMFQGNADFGFRFPSNRVYTTDSKRVAEKFDTLISVRAPVGEQNMALEKCCIGRGVAALRYKNNKNYYTYTYFKFKSLMQEMRKFNETGTIFGSINKTDFENFKITVPSTDMVRKFQDQVKDIDDKVILNCTKINTLIKLRDTLLPKFMSGKLHIIK